MADLNSIVAAKIDGKDVSLGEVLRCLKVAGKLNFVDDALADLLVLRGAKSEGLSATDAELQEAVDAMRRSLKLFKAGDTQKWLSDRRMSVEDLESHAELSILKAKLSDKLITPEQIERYFSENRRTFDQAHIAHIVVKDQGVADEIKTQLVEERADFAKLAEKFSIDEDSKHDGGDLGIVQRTTLSPAVESAVFAAKAGDVVGPIKTDMGYHVIKVHELMLGELTNGVAALIANQLFAKWLDGQVASGKVEVTLYSAI